MSVSGSPLGVSTCFLSGGRDIATDKFVKLIRKKKHK